MSAFLWFIFWLGGLLALAYTRTTLMAASVAILGGLFITTLFSSLSWFILLALWIAFGTLGLLLHHPEYRRRFLVLPLFESMSKNLPRLSPTEKIALEAGTVSWDAELFSGTPQWEKLLTIPAPRLSEEEQAFLEGPVKQVCEMVNDWEVTHQRLDLPEQVWDFLKENGFFGLIIPKKFGGKGFSEWAHSEILTTLACRSVTLSSTVAVPNSLGPAELLLHYGTTEQCDYYLPRLANGSEIPCFALTAPEAGSDATAITDSGIICKGMFNDQEIIGIRLNWNKRYITLAPIATLIGLAFKLFDPEHLLGETEEIGITCALIPSTLSGITIGRRHLPTNIPFQNGPTQGKDVFIPLDWIIGGSKMAGQGWRMLVECLSTGRAISLPATSAGSAKMATLTTGAYTRIRRQFRTPLAEFEGIQEAFARMGGFTYLAEAVRSLTVSMIDMGEKPTVCTAIAKYHVTELGRRIVESAMDIHAGKGIMIGPKNYLIRAFQSGPIGITVEGANILTRNMMIFGQGAIRCHPYLLQEMQALQQDNLPDFEHYLGEHLSYVLANAAGSFFHGITFAKFAGTPVSSEMKLYFQQLSRASQAFAFVSDVTLALLGGKLKFKEALSARLGDMLAMMYLMSAVLKRFQDQGYPKMDLPLVEWTLDYCLATFWQTMAGLLHNLPNKWIALGLKVLVMPFGQPRQYPKDKLNSQITELLTSLSDTRSRLLDSCFISEEIDDSVALLEKAFDETQHHASLIKQIYDATRSLNKGHNSGLKACIDTAVEAKMIHETEAAALYHLESLYQKVIAVDDFSEEELMQRNVGSTRNPLARDFQQDAETDKKVIN